MTARSATHQRRLPAVWLLLAGACAAPATPRFQLAPLSADQQKACVAVEKAYRSSAPDYPAQRDRAVGDPLVAAWLTRMFVRDVIAAREGRPVGKDQALLRAAAHIEDPVEARAIAEIRSLGALAVPTLVGDLLEHDQPQPRDLGVELLTAVGMPAVPALIDVAGHGQSRQRRAAARAIGAVGVDARSLPVVTQLAHAEDFTVRADALRNLHDGGPAVRDLLRERLQNDADPFVRRVAAVALGAFADRAAGTALVDYLERCKVAQDNQGIGAAQDGLQRATGTVGLRTAAAWRAAIASLPAGNGVEAR